MRQLDFSICLTQSLSALLRKMALKLTEKMLAELAARDIDGFKAIVDSVK